MSSVSPVRGYCNSRTARISPLKTHSTISGRMLVPAANIFHASEYGECQREESFLGEERVFPIWDSLG